MDQRSNSWTDWRSKGLGASDAPIIMGVSPWSTPYKLWEIKTGRAKADQGNWATNRGNELEPKARAHVELMLNMDFPAKLVEHQQFNWLRASLDGWNEENRLVLEIKCPGKADHEKAVNGEVPDKYWPQLQHQMLACGTERCVYFSFDGDDGVVVWVYADKDYQKTMFAALCQFWACVQNKTPPPMCDRDYHCVRFNELLGLLDTWAANKATADGLEKRILAHDKVAGRERWRCGKYRYNNGVITIGTDDEG